MSLVAYGASSDEDSDCEIEDVSQSKSELMQPSKETKIIPQLAETMQQMDEQMDVDGSPTFSKLPTPKRIGSATVDIVEEDDEFLRKKAIPLVDATTGKGASSNKVPVKIKIPSLRDFNDVDQDLAKQKAPQQIRGSGLLNMLPVAKSERNFAKTENPGLPNASKAPTKGSFSLIPDSVRHRRPGTNTEFVDGITTTIKKPPIVKPQIVHQPPPVNPDKSNVQRVISHDSDASEDDDAGDFFSLNADAKLPEVSSNEIQSMVANRAARMAKASSKYLKAETDEDEEMETDNASQAQKRPHEEELNPQAIQALVGSSAKRHRHKNAGIEIIDISSDQVLPNREEWMRSTLASSTAYQPTGVLVDEEPVAGTRRKHQITYLAHKAKANEAELQAIWSANRHTRQLTQNKYGF